MMEEKSKVSNTVKVSNNSTVKVVSVCILAILYPIVIFYPWLGLSNNFFSLNFLSYLFTISCVFFLVFSLIKEIDSSMQTEEKKKVEVEKKSEEKKAKLKLFDEQKYIQLWRSFSTDFGLNVETDESKSFYLCTQSFNEVQEFHDKLVQVEKSVQLFSNSGRNSGQNSLQLKDLKFELAPFYKNSFSVSQELSVDRSGKYTVIYTPVLKLSTKSTIDEIINWFEIATILYQVMKELQVSYIKTPVINQNNCNYQGEETKRLEQNFTSSDVLNVAKQLFNAVPFLKRYDLEGSNIIITSSMIGGRKVNAGTTIFNARDHPSKKPICGEGIVEMKMTSHISLNISLLATADDIVDAIRELR